MKIHAATMFVLVVMLALLSLMGALAQAANGSGSGALFMLAICVFSVWVAKNLLKAE